MSWKVRYLVTMGERVFSRASLLSISEEDTHIISINQFGRLGADYFEMFCSVLFDVVGIVSFGRSSIGLMSMRNTIKR